MFLILEILHDFKCIFDRKHFSCLRLFGENPDIQVNWVFQRSGSKGGNPCQAARIRILEMTISQTAVRLC